MNTPSSLSPSGPFSSECCCWLSRLFLAPGREGFCGDYDDDDDDEVLMRKEGDWVEGKQEKDFAAARLSITTVYSSRLGLVFVLGKVTAIL